MNRPSRLFVIPLGLVGLLLAACGSKSADTAQAPTPSPPRRAGRTPSRASPPAKVLIDTGSYTDGPVWHSR